MGVHVTGQIHPQAMRPWGSAPRKPRLLWSKLESHRPVSVGQMEGGAYVSALAQKWPSPRRAEAAAWHGGGVSSEGSGAEGYKCDSPRASVFRCHTFPSVN